MGIVNPRLVKAYQVVQPGIPLPVIILTSESPTAAITSAAQRAGAGPVTFLSAFGRSFGTTATAEVAERIAALPSVLEVAPDDPVQALPKGAA